MIFSGVAKFCCCTKKAKWTLITVVTIYLLTLRCLLTLAGDDLHDVYEEVYTLAARWPDMCLALKLPISCQEMIEANHRGDSARCLQTVLVKWLQKDYNHNRHGPPTWRSLVKAVDNPAGGNNCALAEAVAKKHRGMYM